MSVKRVWFSGEEYVVAASAADAIQTLVDAGYCTADMLPPAEKWEALDPNDELVLNCDGRKEEVTCAEWCSAEESGSTGVLCCTNY